MSRRRRHTGGDPRRRRGPGRHSGWHGITIAIAETPDPGDLEEARRLSHDSLIAQMGPARTGGVSWRQATGDVARRIVLDLMPDDPDGYARALDALGRWPNAVLVIASAPGRPNHRSHT